MDTLALPGELREEVLVRIADMVEAIREGRQPRAAGDLAVHVVEVIAGIVESARRGTPVELTTDFALAPPLSAGDRARLLGRTEH